MYGVGSSLPSAAVVRAHVANAVVALQRPNLQGVVVVDVAVRASVHLAGRGHLVGILQREARRAVVEGRRRQERDSVVAIRAIRRRKQRSCGRMYGVRRSSPSAAVVCIQVATSISAIGQLCRQVVIVIDVAIGAVVDLAARSHLVGVLERKARRAVVKGSVEPSKTLNAVASGAGRHGENIRRSRMLWIRGLVPIGQMAHRVATI